MQFTSIENLNSENSSSSKKFYITNQEGSDGNSEENSNKRPMNVLTSYWRNFMEGTGTQKYVLFKLKLTF